MIQCCDKIYITFSFHQVSGSFELLCRNFSINECKLMMLAVQESNFFTDVMILFVNCSMIWFGHITSEKILYAVSVLSLVIWICCNCFFVVFYVRNCLSNLLTFCDYLYYAQKYLDLFICIIQHERITQS